MRRFVFSVAMGVAALAAAAADNTATNAGVTFTVDFNSFTGTWASLPAGFSVSKDGTNGMTEADGDFRGSHEGGVVAGGCYAWALGDGDFALGCQPTADAFTPGFFQLTILSSSPRPVERISFSYEVVCLNNADRASSLNMEVSFDGVTFQALAALRFVSPAGQDPAPAWTRTVRSCDVVFSPAIRVDRPIRIRWRLDDAGGASSRDEYGIDNVRLTLVPVKGLVVSIR